MSENGYKVIGAINYLDFEFPDGLSWDNVYSDNLSIDMDNMMEAVTYLRNLQENHDSKFKEFASSIGINLKTECPDWWNYRPYYLSHFYYWDSELGDWELTRDYEY